MGRVGPCHGPVTPAAVATYSSGRKGTSPLTKRDAVGLSGELPVLLVSPTYHCRLPAGQVMNGQSIFCHGAHVFHGSSNTSSTDDV